VISDIQEAADQLLPVYERTFRQDGYVSLEVSPKLAHDTYGTVVEASRLWETVDRKNLMIKVPATDVPYQQYQNIFSGPRWEQLAGQGAQTQRLLWASTGTKNPAYSDILYIEELIGPDTVNTAPPATIDAFRDHGHVRTSLHEGVDEARAVLAQLEARGISLDEITRVLLTNGIALFEQAYDDLIQSITEKI